MEKIKVEIRIRPNRNNILDFTHNKITVGANTFTFAKVHHLITQKSLFTTSVSPLIDKFLSGENCSIMAYGQTGSGKTYTIGISSHLEIHKNKQRIPENAIIQNALESIFSKNVKVSCTFIEIYNEEIYDLLGEGRIPLKIRQGIGEASIIGLKEVEADSYEKSLELLSSGTERRTTKSTKMNVESSRSHAIFTIVLRQAKEEKIIVSKMAFVDLAGSERLKRTECIGSRARESISINSGLLAMGNVINSLYMKKSHIPFRDSKLTRILEKCLVGNVFLIACISGLQEDIHETTNTLKYACRAAQITLNSEIKVENDKDKLVIQNLKRQISNLREENNRLKALVYQNSFKSKDIQNHPFVIELMARIKAYEENEYSINTNLIKVKTHNSNMKSQEKQIELAIDKLDITQSDSDTSFDSDKTLYQPIQTDEHETEDIVNEKTQNTLRNRNISPIKEEASELKNDSKKRRRLVSFDTEPTNKSFVPISGNKVSFKLIDTVTDVSPISLVLHENKLLFNCVDNKIRFYDSKLSKVSLLVSDESIKCLNSSESLYYSTRSLLKVYSGQGRPMPIYAYPEVISCMEIDKNIVYTGHSNGLLNILDLRSNKIVFDQKIHEENIFDIKINGNQIYTCSKDYNVKYNDLRCFSDSDLDVFKNPEFHVLVPPHEDVISSMLLYKNKCISLSRDCSIRSWNDDRLVDMIPEAHDNWIKCGISTNDFFATGCRGGTIKCWDFYKDSLQCISKFSIGTGINCMINDKNTIWVGGQNKNIYRYSYNIG